MAKYEIVEAPKNLAPSEDAVRAVVAKERPGFRIEALRETEDTWEIRLAEFPFKKDEESSDDSSDDSSDAPKETEDDSADDSSDDSTDDKDSEDGDSEEKKDKKDNKSDGEGDALGRLRELVGDIQSLFDELTNKAQETVDKADAQQSAVDEIGDTLDAHRSPKAEPGLGAEPGLEPGAGLDDLGPVPGGPVAPPKAPGAPKPPTAPAGLDKRKRPVPPGPGVSMFTHRHEVATHPGVDHEGNRITLTAAAQELESSDAFADYEVVSVVEDADGQYVAKLRLRN